MSSAAIETEMAPALRDFEHLSDITFSVEDKTFHLHRTVLAARSEWFRAMLSGEWKEKTSSEISFSSVTSDVFGCVMEYLYTGRVQHMTPDIVSRCFRVGLISLSASR